MWILDRLGSCEGNVRKEGCRARIFRTTGLKGSCALSKAYGGSLFCAKSWEPCDYLTGFRRVEDEESANPKP